MKQNSKISFRVVAYTDAAGKYSPDAFRNGNEDNFYVNEDLTGIHQAQPDETIQLGEYGMLMVVADGMGGMNAGEVASQIAIDPVKMLFSPECLLPATRQKYLEQAIKLADKNIKNEAKKNITHEGMGSTIILAWLYGTELSISWCGDSRIYLFNEKSGIRLISQDHSYVQDLVMKGILTYDQTFDHPQNNIITRSLGDPTKDARPDSKTLHVGKGDIILLCSDGLSGVLRDRKTYDVNGQPYPEANIEDIIRANVGSMKSCREALWLYAEKGGWYDNVTAILCQIVDGPESSWAMTPCAEGCDNNIKKKNLGYYIVTFILFLVAIIATFFIGRISQETTDCKVIPIDNTIEVSNQEIEKDSIIIDNLSIQEKQEEIVNKKTIQEKVRQQSDEKIDSILSSPNGLTKIVKDEDNERTSNRDKLTPIQNEVRKKNVENPTSSTITKKDNITDNPANK